MAEKKEGFLIEDPDYMYPDAELAMPSTVVVQPIIVCYPTSKTSIMIMIIVIYFLQRGRYDGSSRFGKTTVSEHSSFFIRLEN